jgi:tRNA modification GTPase
MKHCETDRAAAPAGAPATIFAPASGAGVGAVAVVRLSGPAAAAAVCALAGTLPAPRQATLRCLSDPATGETLDRALVIWFPGPASYTGDDAAEFHLHGGVAVQQSVLAALAAQPGLRLAEPGEFTRRAFENGKFDLTAAEGVADLVAARTAGQRRQALAQLGGGLGALYEGWRNDLVRALAHLEADIDFPDEDLPETVAGAVQPVLAAVHDAILAHIDDGHRGERIRDGFRIAIIGSPNAGKSSLLNCLAKRDAAIVSTVAGTTRDVVEVHMDLGGFAVVLADTAGLRETGDDVEREGVRRARQAAEAADLRLIVVDSTQWPHLDETVETLIDGSSILVLNKADLGDPLRLAAAASERVGWPIRAVSALTGAGIDALVGEVRRIVTVRLGRQEAPALTRARHREALGECREALERALAGTDTALLTEDVRIATRALGRITGRVDIDEVLDVIFRDFCIGK